MSRELCMFIVLILSNIFWACYSLYQNEDWFKRAMYQNREWYEMCTKMNEKWAEDYAIRLGKLKMRIEELEEKMNED